MKPGIQELIDPSAVNVSALLLSSTALGIISIVFLMLLIPVFIIWIRIEITRLRQQANKIPLIVKQLTNLTAAVREQSEKTTYVLQSFAELLRILQTSTVSAETLEKIQPFTQALHDTTLADDLRETAAELEKAQKKQKEIEVISLLFADTVSKAESSANVTITAGTTDAPQD